MFRFLLASTALFVLSSPVQAQTLPAPYFLHALDAVLTPINDDMRSSFALGAEQGVLVLAAAPDGVADDAGGDDMADDGGDEGGLRWLRW